LPNKTECEEAIKLYEKALEESLPLRVTHPVVLYAACNFSVFLFEIQE